MDMTAAGGRRGAGGVQALVGALHDEFTDELRERGEDVEDEPTAGGYRGPRAAR